MVPRVSEDGAGQDFGCLGSSKHFPERMECLVLSFAAQERKRHIILLGW